MTTRAFPLIVIINLDFTIKSTFMTIIRFCIELCIRNIVINILFYISIIIYLARALSKNYVARSIENQKFIRIQAKIVHRFQAFNKSLKDKQNKYLVCPECAQIIRVPRNKGKIEVRCPSCRKSFDAKS